jgi:6-phosphogluconolactonase (cycloisomerase 2 family)
MGADSATALVADSHVNGWPAITSDGKWLYYFSFDMSGPEIPKTYRFMRKPLAGGEAQQVDTQTGLIRGLRCAVSVNLCIHAKQGDDEIVYFKVDPELGKLKEFSHDQMVPIAEFFRWDVSPDGRYLAHIDQTGQSNDIRIMSVDNPKDIRVMHLPQLELLRSLRWDAQSRGFFVSTHNDNGDMLILYHIGMDGTINMLRQQPGGVQGWVIPSPDGKRLAIQSWVFDGNIWMLKRD